MNMLHARAAAIEACGRKEVGKPQGRALLWWSACRCRRRRATAATGVRFRRILLVACRVAHASSSMSRKPFAAARAASGATASASVYEKSRRQ